MRYCPSGKPIQVRVRYVKPDHTHVVLVGGGPTRRRVDHDPPNSGSGNHLWTVWTHAKLGYGVFLDENCESATRVSNGAAQTLAPSDLAKKHWSSLKTASSERISEIGMTRYSFDG